MPYFYIIIDVNTEQLSYLIITRDCHNVISSKIMRLVSCAVCTYFIILVWSIKAHNASLPQSVKQAWLGKHGGIECILVTELAYSMQKCRSLINKSIVMGSLISGFLLDSSFFGSRDIIK